MNPLTLIPESARAVVYTAYAFLGVVLGSVVVAFAAAGADQPLWLIVTLAVYTYLGGVFGVTATSNVPAARRALPPSDEV